jgi:hypothetical protein
MFWLILLGIVIAAIGGYYVYVAGDWVWGQAPIPPAQPIPLITSAVGTSARTVQLTLSKTPGMVLVQRYWPYDGTTFDFLTDRSAVVDEIVLPETADLLPERLFRYRARYTSSTFTSMTSELAITWRGLLLVSVSFSQSGFRH